MNETVDQSQLADRAAGLVEAALKVGADQADAVCVRGIALSVDVREGKTEETNRAEGDDFTLRAFVGTRSAAVSANVLSDPVELAERAVAMARVAPEDPFAGLADPGRLGQSAADLELMDTHMPGAEQLAESARAAEAAALSVEGVAKSGGASASWSLGGMVLATSHGFTGTYQGSHFGVSASEIAGHGTGMERDYDYETRVFQADLPDPAVIGRNAGERVVKRLNPRKIPTGTVTAVFHPRVASGLIGHLASAANGASVARKTSFLRDNMSQMIFNPSVTISDDPFRRRGLGSRPFDGEGVAGEALDLVRDGILQTWLLDTSSARELGLATNGRASRGGANPSPGTTNLTLQPGETTPQDLIASIDRGIYVTELIGHGVNMITGDYSRGVAGFLIENGELGYPVSEIVIASNLRDMFRSLQPASDLIYRSRTNAPTVAIEGMMVAGTDS